MIDIESDVFDKVSKAIKEEFPNAFVSGENVDVPAKLPAVSIVESDNRVFQRMRTTNIENAAIVMYECNVYSNKASGKKAEAKKIAAVMDETFASIGFTRTFKNQDAYNIDPKIFREIFRYEAVVDKDLWIYQNE